MKKRIFSRILALVMALSLLSTTAFAASFADLQDAINGTKAAEGAPETANGTMIGDTGHYGYGWNTETNKWGITAWDQEGTHKVELNEDVLFDRDGADKDRVDGTKNAGIIIEGDEQNYQAPKYEVTKFAIELNGHTIDLNPGAELNAEDGKFYKLDENNSRTETVVSDEDLNWGSVIRIDKAAHVTITDSTTKTVETEDGSIRYIAGSGTGKITGGNVMGSGGGGISVNNTLAPAYLMSRGARSALVMNGGIVTGNKANNAHGGGIYLGGNGIHAENEAELNGVFVSNNTSFNGAGIYNHYRNTVTIKDSVVTQNHATISCGGVDVGSGAAEKFKIENTTLCGNTGVYDSSQLRVLNFANDTENPINHVLEDQHIWIDNGEATDITVKTPATCIKDGIGYYNHKDASDGCPIPIVLPATGQHSDGIWVTTTPAAPGVSGVESFVCPDCGTVFETRELPALPASGAGAGDDDFAPVAADTTTEIEDEETPLAGLISRAQLVSYLYSHEGSPDGEDAEGEYTLAWAWAVKNEIADEKDDPEEIITVAILREVMTSYAAYLDTTFDVEIEGEDDMIVVDCDKVLAEFYASLEDKAA